MSLIIKKADENQKIEPGIHKPILSQIIFFSILYISVSCGKADYSRMNQNQISTSKPTTSNTSSISNQSKLANQVPKSIEASDLNGLDNSNTSLDTVSSTPSISVSSNTNSTSTINPNESNNTNIPIIIPSKSVLNSVNKSVPLGIYSDSSNTSYSTTTNQPLNNKTKVTLKPIKIHNPLIPYTSSFKNNLETWNTTSTNKISNNSLLNINTGINNSNLNNIGLNYNPIPTSNMPSNLGFRNGVMNCMNSNQSQIPNLNIFEMLNVMSTIQPNPLMCNQKSTNNSISIPNLNFQQSITKMTPHIPMVTLENIKHLNSNDTNTNTNNDGNNFKNIPHLRLSSNNSNNSISSTSSSKTNFSCRSNLSMDSGNSRILNSSSLRPRNQSLSNSVNVNSQNVSNDNSNISLQNSDNVGYNFKNDTFIIPKNVLYQMLSPDNKHNQNLGNSSNKNHMNSNSPNSNNTNSDGNSNNINTNKKIINDFSSNMLIIPSDLKNDLLLNSIIEIIKKNYKNIGFLSRLKYNYFNDDYFFREEKPRIINTLVPVDLFIQVIDLIGLHKNKQFKINYLKMIMKYMGMNLLHYFSELSNVLAKIINKVIYYDNELGYYFSNKKLRHCIHTVLEFIEVTNENEGAISFLLLEESNQINSMVRSESYIREKPYGKFRKLNQYADYNILYLCPLLEFIIRKERCCIETSQHHDKLIRIKNAQLNKNKYLSFLHNKIVYKVTKKHLFY